MQAPSHTKLLPPPPLFRINLRNSNAGHLLDLPTSPLLSISIMLSTAEWYTRISIYLHNHVFPCYMTYRYPKKTIFLKRMWKMESHLRRNASWSWVIWVVWVALPVALSELCWISWDVWVVSGCLNYSQLQIMLRYNVEGKLVSKIVNCQLNCFFFLFQSAWAGRSSLG